MAFYVQKSTKNVNALDKKWHNFRHKCYWPLSKKNLNISHTRQSKPKGNLRNHYLPPSTRRRSRKSDPHVCRFWRWKQELSTSCMDASRWLSQRKHQTAPKSRTRWCAMCGDAERPNGPRSERSPRNEDISFRPSNYHSEDWRVGSVL